MFQKRLSFSYLLYIVSTKHTDEINQLFIIFKTSEYRLQRIMRHTFVHNMILFFNAFRYCIELKECLRMCMCLFGQILVSLIGVTSFMFVQVFLVCYFNLVFRELSNFIQKYSKTGVILISKRSRTTFFKQVLRNIADPYLYGLYIYIHYMQLFICLNYTLMHSKLNINLYFR